MRRFGSAAIIQMSGAIARLAALFFAGRWIAQTLGPVGVAALGQIQNLVGLASALGIQALQLGFQQGSAARPDPRERASWCSTGILLGSALVIAGSAAVAIAWKTGIVQAPFEGGWWILLLPLLILPGVWTAAWQGEALGRSRWLQASLWNAGSGFLQASLWVAGVVLWGVPGLVGAILCQSLILLPFSARFLSGSGFLNPRHLKTWLRAWAPLVFAGAAPAVCAPLAGIVVRTLMSRHGWESAGIWQAAARIPELLYPIWNGVVGTWVLSRVAASKGREGVSMGILVRSLAATSALSLVLWLGAKPILHLAWGPGFEQAIPLLRLQTLAEVPRTATWIFTAALLGRARAKAVVSLELVGFSIFCGGTYFLQDRWGLLAPALSSILDNSACLALAGVLWMRERNRM